VAIAASLRQVRPRRPAPDVPYGVFDVEVTPLSTATLTRDTGT
jgi:hypothetical protein